MREKVRLESKKLEREMREIVSKKLERGEIGERNERDSEIEEREWDAY